MAVKAPAVGIDLGTTSSSIAVVWRGKVEAIPNDQDGRTTTTSCITFRGTQCVVGDQDVTDFSNTLFDAKRLFGRKFEDPSVQYDMKYWPFEVMRGEGGKPKMNVQVGRHQASYYPEELSSILLAKLKASAEAFLLGITVSEAVVSIPAHFNHHQRQQVLDAAAIAGFNVLRFIKEPVASAYSFWFENKDMFKGFIEGDRHVLVFDLGGGSCDVAVMAIYDGILELKSMTTDFGLGGNNFDMRMVNHFIVEFKRKTGSDLSKSKRALCLLRSAVQSAKVTLSDQLEAEIDIPDLFEGIHFQSCITRQRFEELNDDLFRGTLEGVDKALRDARMYAPQVHDVVLVGGSTFIPKIQQMLAEYFPGKELKRCAGDQKGTVAFGAAIQAAILGGDNSMELQDTVILEAIPISLGIETSGGVMTTMIKRNSFNPVRQTRTIRPGEIGSLVIKVFEGEGAMTVNNRLVGQFQLPQNISDRIDVTVDVDGHGVLSGTVEIGQEVVTMTLHKDEGSLTNEDIERMANEVQGYRDQWACYSGKSKSNLNHVVPAMFNKPDFSDVTLNCEGLTFHCHKTILSANSPVFRQMFILDTQEARQSVVQIQDLEKDVLKLMIEWIYGVDIKSKLGTFGQTVDLYKAADRYLLESFKAWLTEELVSGMTAENAFEVYILGDMCHDDRLKSNALEVMKRKRRDVFADKQVFDECYTRYPDLLQTILTD